MSKERWTLFMNVSSQLKFTLKPTVLSDNLIGSNWTRDQLARRKQKSSQFFLKSREIYKISAGQCALVPLGE